MELLNETIQFLQRRQWHPTPVLLPGKSHGWRSLVGCSPCGRWGSDMTERLHFHFSLSCIGEGNGNPLQCSCLENPRDGRAWWAAISGVTQSRTRLKWLSSSSIQFLTLSTQPHTLKETPEVNAKSYFGTFYHPPSIHDPSGPGLGWGEWGTFLRCGIERGAKTSVVNINNILMWYF